MTSERAKILLEAAQQLHSLHKNEADRGKAEGILIAAKTLKRMASQARAQDKRVEEGKRRDRAAADAKARAFGY